MNDVQVERPTVESATDLVFARFQRDVREVLRFVHVRVEPTTRLEDLLPKKERRHLWRKLRAHGYRLPNLTISPTVMNVRWFMLLIRFVFVGWFVNFLFASFGALLSFLWWQLTRPLASCPPPGCETVREAVLHATPFRKEDYAAGLWPRDELAGKVRAIVALQLGLPFDEITEETRFVDLCD